MMRRWVIALLGFTSLTAPQWANAVLVWSWNDASPNNYSLMTLSAENTNNGAVYDSYTWLLLDLVFTPIYNSNARMQTAYISAQAMAQSEAHISLTIDCEVPFNWSVFLLPTGNALSTHGSGSIDDDYTGWYASQQFPGQNQQAIQVALSPNMLDTTGDGIKDLSIVTDTNTVVLLGVGVDVFSSVYQDFGPQLTVRAGPLAVEPEVAGLGDGVTARVTSNYAFRVEHSTDLATWTTNATATSTGALTTVTIPFPTNAGFFRVAVPIP